MAKETTKEIKISPLRNWGRPRRKKQLPAFLLSKEERDELLRSKRKARGRPRTRI